MMHREHGGSLNAVRTIRSAFLGLAKAVALGISAVTAAPIQSVTSHHPDDGDEEEGAAKWVLFIISMVLVLLGGAFAGLTIALMGQDGTYLKVITQDATEKQHKNAKRVLDLLNKGKHWVLVTLLLSNVIVNETLPVVLDRCLGGGLAAVAGSTVLIVIFGEILPQSICVRYGLQIGGYMSKPVLFLMYLMAPVAWPTAKLLDWLLGEDHGTLYKKSGLKELVDLHRFMGDVSERLNEDEATIIRAVLDLKNKSVESVMTPMEDVFIMSEDTVLDEKTIDRILDAGYSRIPIHQTGNPTNFIGMLLVKILITYDPEDAKRVKDFSLATLPETWPQTSCLDIINYFQEGKSHMVLVTNQPGDDSGALGVVTLEDVIEELIGEEIIDESDVYVDVHKAIRRAHPAPKIRVHKDLVAKDSAIKDMSLIDVMEEAEERESKLPEDRQHQKLALNGRNDETTSTSAPQTTLLMRRSSAGQDGQIIHTTIPVKANYEEMKGHLKHLGPSNPASNPKNTKVSSIKIKPAPDKTRASSVSVALNGIAEHPASGGDELDEADERTGLLTAKDGIKALRQNYSYGSSPTNQRPTVVTNVDGALSNEQASPTKDSPHSENGSSTSVVSQPSGVRKWTGRGYVRSGSITENVIEAGGIRKVILEPTSSGEEGEAESTNITRSPIHQRSLSKTSLVVPGHVTEDDEGESDAGRAGSSSNLDAPSDTGSKRSNGKKKHPKKKKRHGGK